MISTCLFTNLQVSLAGEFNKIDNIDIGIENWNKNFKECFGKSLNHLNDDGKIEEISVKDKQAIEELCQSYKDIFEDKNYDCGKILSWILVENTITYRYIINDRIAKSRKAVSYAVLKKIKTDFITYYYLDFIWTDKNFQKRGYGYNLLDYILKKVQNEGMFLELHAKNAGYNLYKKILVEFPNKKDKKNIPPVFKSLLGNRLYENVKMCKKLKRSNSYGLMSFVEDSI